MTDRRNDRFFGGPLDGHEAPMNPAFSIQDERVDPETGAVYRRADSLDEGEYAGWVFVVEQREVSGVHQLAVSAASKSEPLTLDRLGELVDSARALKMCGSAQVHALVFFKGTVKRLELRG